jgi:hypothetical protein
VVAAETVAPHLVGMSTCGSAACPMIFESRHAPALGEPMADFIQQTGPAWPEQFPSANTYMAHPLVALHLVSHTV